MKDYLITVLVAAFIGAISYALAHPFTVTHDTGVATLISAVLGAVLQFANNWLNSHNQPPPAQATARKPRTARRRPLV